MIEDNMLDCGLMKILNRERNILFNNSLIMDLNIISSFKFELSRISGLRNSKEI
jgi:hypothetical protein